MNLQRLLNTSLILLTISSGAWAGITNYYRADPPIRAEISMDRKYVAPGGTVSLTVTDGMGGPPYDWDMQCVNNILTRVRDDIYSVTWSATGGTVNYSFPGATATWTFPTNIAEGTYTVSMWVYDAAKSGVGSSDTLYYGAHYRTATVVVTRQLPASYLSARPGGASSVSLQWYPWDADPNIAQTYTIFRKEGATGAWDTGNAVSKTGAGPFTDVDNAVTTGTTYYYKISVMNGGTTMWSPEVIATPKASQPTAVAYAANSYSNNVLVVDTTSNQVYATIAIGKTFAPPGSAGPLGVAVAPDGARAYITNYGPNPKNVDTFTDHESSVSVIEAATNREEDMDTAPNTTSPPTAPPGMSRITVRQPTDDPNRVFRLEGMAVSPDGRYVYVANYGGPRAVGAPAPDGTDWPGSIDVIDTLGFDTSAPDRKFTKQRLLDAPSDGYSPGIGHPIDLALTPNGNFLLATNAADYAYKDGNGQDVVVPRDSIAVIDVNNPANAPNVLSLTNDTSNGRWLRPQGITMAEFEGSDGLPRAYAYVAMSLGESVNVIDVTLDYAPNLLTYDGSSSNPPLALPRPSGSPNIYCSPVDIAATSDGKFIIVVGTQGWNPGLPATAPPQFPSYLWVIDVAESPGASNVHAPILIRNASAQPEYGAGRVTVAVDTSGGTTKYKVYTTHFNSNKITVTTLNADGMEDNTARAGIDTGKANPSTNLISGVGGIAIRPTMPLLAAPTDLTASPLTWNPTTQTGDPYPGIKLDWQWNGSNGGEFIIERRVPNSLQWITATTVKAQLGATAQTWTEQFLDSSQTYYYRVRAADVSSFMGDVKSVYSNTAIAQQRFCKLPGC